MANSLAQKAFHPRRASGPALLLGTAAVATPPVLNLGDWCHSPSPSFHAARDEYAGVWGAESGGRSPELDQLRPLYDSRSGRRRTQRSLDSIVGGPDLPDPVGGQESSWVMGVLSGAARGVAVAPMAYNSDDDTLGQSRRWKKTKEATPPVNAPGARVDGLSSWATARKRGGPSSATGPRINGAARANGMSSVERQQNKTGAVMRGKGSQWRKLYVVRLLQNELKKTTLRVQLLEEAACKALQFFRDTGEAEPKVSPPTAQEFRDTGKASSVGEGPTSPGGMRGTENGYTFLNQTTGPAPPSASPKITRKERPTSAPAAGVRSLQAAKARGTASVSDLVGGAGWPS